MERLRGSVAQAEAQAQVSGTGIGTGNVCYGKQRGATLVDTFRSGQYFDSLNMGRLKPQLAPRANLQRSDSATAFTAAITLGQSKKLSIQDGVPIFSSN